MRLKLSILAEAYERAMPLHRWLAPDLDSPDQILARVFERGVELLETGGTLAPLTGPGGEPLERLNEERQQALVAEATYAFMRQRMFVMARECERLESSADELGEENRRLRTEAWEARAVEQQTHGRRLQGGRGNGGGLA
jgi:hypothetical protein